MDFALLFSMEDKAVPVSVKIRSSILLTFGIVTICWSSKIQSEIVLSTLDATYIAPVSGNGGSSIYT